MSSKSNVSQSSMGGDSKSCVQFFSLRTLLRVIVCVFCLSTVVYVYLYNISIVNTSAHLLGQRFNISVWTEESYKFMNLSNTRSLFYNFKHKDIKLTTVINNTREEIPLLTLFTTWPPNDTKYKVRNITLRNWAQFKPLVKPIFFYSNGTDTKDMIKYGWDILPVGKTAANGVPVLKYMYLDVLPKYKSLFYGYANGDLLFDGGLIHTLLTVANASLRQDKPIFIIGQRTNVNSVTDEESKEISNLATVAKNRGKVFVTVAEDYFITDSSWPWADIPGVVIGRRAYDNWLVLHACKQKHTVIDATGTLLALHQSTKAGNFEGHSHKDGEYNAGLLSKLYKNIQYGAGATSCAPWRTELIGNATHKKVQLSRRAKLERYCYQY